MEANRLFSEIERLYPEYLKIWEDVCNLESPTRNKAAVDAVADYFVRIAEERGWQVERLSLEKAGDPVCITINPEADAAPVAFSGHLDTVHPIGLFPSPAVRFDEKNIYGPGVMDCKGGAVASLLAMDALCNCGFKARPVMLILQTDEEVSSVISDLRTIDFMCEKAKDAVAFINTEGGTYGTAVIQRKGIMRYEFRVHGIAAHSSVCFSAANAVTEAAHKIIELERMKDEHGLTCNCGVISGGTTPNTVAEHCTFTADIRFATAEQMAFAEEEVRRIADTVFVKGCSCECVQLSRRPAMELCHRNEELLRRINEINGQVGLPLIAARPEPSGSDAAYTTIHGIPTVDNLGVVGDFIHSVNEFAEQTSLMYSARQMAAVAAFI